MKQDLLHTIAREWRNGKRAGIMSACTASPLCIEAALREAGRRGKPALIEATANQVNPEGGYTGMNAARYREFVLAIAKNAGFPEEMLILGGDHLGPLPYKGLAEDAAMANAEKLVYEYAAAGFSKLHLDTSMALSSDAAHLGDELIARRAARLARAAARGFAERKRREPDALFPELIIGSEVPIPGGSQAGGLQDAGDAGLAVTSPQAFRATVEAFKAAFAADGLESVWERVVGVVVQPGVEFGDDDVHIYNAQAAAALSAELRNHSGIIFEGHSTDYQPRSALREMARDGICILKVGPALTFYRREALFALAAIETELFDAGLIPSSRFPSRFPETLDAAMLAAPANWQNYYHGSAAEQRYKRKFSYSDRSRYYMSLPSITESTDRLFDNLSAVHLPYALLSQYMPAQAAKAQNGEIETTPRGLVLSRITDVIEDYREALGTLEKPDFTWHNRQ